MDLPEHGEFDWDTEQDKAQAMAIIDGFNKMVLDLRAEVAEWREAARGLVEALKDALDTLEFYATEEDVFAFNENYDEVMQAVKKHKQALAAARPQEEATR